MPLRFSQRDAVANMLCTVGWRHGDDPDPHVRYVQGFWPSLERHTHGFHVNDMSPGVTATRIRESYQRNHDRLVEVKDRYDPANPFRLNANIQPTA